MANHPVGMEEDRMSERREGILSAIRSKVRQVRPTYHHQDDVIGFCPDYRHPWGCQDDVRCYLPKEFGCVVDGCDGMPCILRTESAQPQTSDPNHPAQQPTQPYHPE